MPGRQRIRWAPSEMFGVDTWARISRISSAADPRLKSLVSIRTPRSMAFLIVSVAAFGSSALLIAPPTMTIEAPAAAAAAAVAELTPPAPAPGVPAAAAPSRSVSNGSRPSICWSMGQWIPTTWAPNSSACRARATGSSTPSRSTSTLKP